MQFITTLLGGNGAILLNAAFALGAVLVGIVMVLWLLKLLMGRAENWGRARQKRLTIVETAQVDGKRRLVIIRRDNVEHVLLTGGPQDVIVESGIEVQPAPSPAQRRPQPRPAPIADPVPETPLEPAPAETRVPHEAVERLNDLARPAPLRPRPPSPAAALRRIAANRESTPVIPKGPTLRVDNSVEAPTDSATTTGDGSSVVQPGTSGPFRRINRPFRKSDA